LKNVQNFSEQKHLDNLIPFSARNSALIEIKHQQIVNGACELFIDKGFFRTSIREIARASRMSMGQLYHYISSKDDILFLVYRNMEKIWMEHLISIGIEEIEDPFEKLLKALRSTIEYMVENKKLNQFFYTETKFLEKKQLRVALERFDKNFVGFWRRILKEVNKQKPVKIDVNFAAATISYLMFFIPLSGWNLKSKSKKNINYLADFILRGLGIVS